MKVKNKNLPDFKVPLSDEVVNILKDQHQYTSHQEYVFLSVNNKVLNRDNIRDIEENIKGSIALLGGLQFADETGQHIYQREAYITLQTALGKAVKDLEDIKGSVNYMMDKFQL